MSTNAIRGLRVSRFGPFDGDYDLAFTPGINVVVGDNGTGKSQLLKLLYGCTEVLEHSGKEHESTKSALQRRMAEKLVGIFRPDSLGRLVTRQQGRAKTLVEVDYGEATAPLRFSFATNSKSEVRIDSVPDMMPNGTPVFLPARELMSIYPGFVSLYDSHELEFDETMRDTCLLLGLPTRRRNSPDISRALRPIEEILGGHVEQVSGRFYLNGRPEGNFEMPLVAEGLRKLATIARLVQCGVLIDEGYLFWDEPEANLNPASQRAITRMVAALACNGIQVFLGTHSAFLLRQLLLDRDLAGDGFPALSFTALHRAPDAPSSIRVKQAADLNDIDLGYLATLKSEYDQADEILEQ